MVSNDIGKILQELQEASADGQSVSHTHTKQNPQSNAGLIQSNHTRIQKSKCPLAGSKEHENL